MHYTENQQRAIETATQNLQIIACAGSGKTQVMAARVVHLLKSGAESGLTPAGIVAFTFTEKAAAELKDRILRLFDMYRKPQKRDTLGSTCIEKCIFLYMKTSHV